MQDLLSSAHPEGVWPWPQRWSSPTSIELLGLRRRRLPILRSLREDSVVVAKGRSQFEDRRQEKEEIVLGVAK